MFTDPEQRGVIFVNSDPESGDVESWLSHETLHNVLNDHGEVNASYAIDERRDEDTPNPENTGLYYWTPRPRRAR